MLSPPEVVTVFGFAPPSLLTGGFAGLAAGGLGTVALTPQVASVGIKEHFAVLTLALSDVTDHGPQSPQVHDQRGVGWTEEYGEEKTAGRRVKKTEEGE
jgi:hypothetical protein